MTPLNKVENFEKLPRSLQGRRYLVICDFASVAPLLYIRPTGMKTPKITAKTCDVLTITLLKRSCTTILYVKRRKYEHTSKIKVIAYSCIIFLYGKFLKNILYEHMRKKSVVYFLAPCYFSRISTNKIKVMAQTYFMSISISMMT